jgi:hypothetical protein
MAERKALIDGLREFAQFLEDNPEAPMPTATAGGRYNVFLPSRAAFVAAAKAVGGKLDKKDYPELMVLRRQFGPIEYDLNVKREQVCERVLVGTRTVPAVDAQPQHQEDVFEWKCGSLLEPTE